MDKNPQEIPEETTHLSKVISIRDYKGNLHGHTKEGGESTPEQTVSERVGSNCGELPLDALAEYHLEGEKPLQEYIAITEHSRDPCPKEALEGISKWFQAMYLKALGKPESELTPEEGNTIKRNVDYYTKELMDYGDERLERILEEIDKVSKDKEVQIIKGIEVTMCIDGTFDTKMVEEGAFELVNVSIHPSQNEEGFEPILKSPELYTQLILKGLSNKKTNIMCHLQRDAPKFEARGWKLEDLGWEEIAATALKNQVAIEINLKNFYNNYLNGAVDAPRNRDNTTLKEELPELIPILSSKNIRDRLRPYFEKGLKISINTDEHENPFAQDIALGVDPTKARKRNFQFWRSMKIMEGYLNELFQDAGITKESIINTYPLEKLKRFLKKEVT